jgi:hypothetical protein
MKIKTPPPIVHLTLKSSNIKTGPMPASTSGASTCPDSCPLKSKGCYAKGGPLNMHWNKVSNADRGTTWQTFLDTIATLPEGQIWRHNQAGDLPGDNDAIAPDLLAQLVKANSGRRGFTYTHKPVLNSQRGPVAANRRAIARANQKGFTVNLSANGLNHADKLAALNVGPVVTILPPGIQKNTMTPKGRKVVICPAQVREDVTCLTCRLCSRANRSAIIGFIPHGSARRVAGAVAQTNT